MKNVLATLTAEVHFQSRDLHLNIFRLTDIKCKLNISGERREEHWKGITDNERYIQESLEI